MRGGRGEVWLAYDTELPRAVALKRARIRDDTMAAFHQMRREASALAELNHPHVVTLFDAVRVPTADRAAGAADGGPAEGETWLVMEYVSGGDLADQPTTSPREAARVGAQIAGALRALHDKGIAHCDVKPANILLTQDGTPKLTDLDAAFRVECSETITPHRLAFTPDYAAPEVVRGSPTYASDVFSLGATLHALVTGGPPRRRRDVGADTGEVVRTESFLAPRGTVHLDGDLGVLTRPLTRMLQPDPQDRPDATEARRMLEEAAGLRKPLRRPDRRYLAAGAGVVLLALAVAGGVRWWPGGGSILPGEDHTARSGRVASIGDQRTADPCALTDPTALDRFGRAELDRAYGNFDRCDVLLSSGGDEFVDVKVDLNNGPASELDAPSRTVGSVQVVEEGPESEECNRTLVLDGEKDAHVTVTAKLVDERAAPLCDIADVATGSAVEVLNRGELPRRAGTPVEASLAHRDACTVLDGKALAVVPGIDAEPEDVGFGNWDCQWRSSTRDIVVDLRFDRSPPLNAQEDGRVTRVGGHDVFLQAEGEGDQTCLAQVVHREYPAGDGTAVETVRLTVGGPQSMDRLCDLTTALAGSVAASAELSSR